MAASTTLPLSERVKARSAPRSQGRQDRAERARPRKVTHKRLENIALHYLGRYASSTENLRRVLRRRVARATAGMPTDMGPDMAVDQEAAEGWIDEILAKLQRLGMLDDANYAAARARSLHRQGRSSRHIRGTLSEKGVDGDLIEAALDERAETMADPEFAAACHYARRRRLGPYSHKPADEVRQKRDLAALARAGFGYAIASKVVDAPSREALEEAALEKS
ncbi:MAG: regulatory protein RecX [Alphaproteobacteria bacterium]